MSYEQLAYIHFATVVPAFAIGTWLLVRRKGSLSHRALGRVYLVLMGYLAARWGWQGAKAGFDLLQKA
mgnify:CR=1 FL=1